MSEATDDPYTVILELRECLHAWEPQVRVLGNVRACDALEAIDTLLTLAQRYAVLRQQGCYPAVVMLGVLIGGPRDHINGTKLDHHTDSLRKRSDAKCPRGFWCVHDVLCEGARRRS